MFVSVFSTRASLGAQIDEMQRYSLFDVTVAVPRTVSIHVAEREAGRVPGVAVAEGWASTRATIVRGDGTEGGEVEIRTTPGDSITIEPLMESGRWLVSNDGLNIVVSADLLDNEPEVRVGDSLALSINGDAYTVVGIASRHINRVVAYMDYRQFVKATGWADPVSEVRIRLDHDQLGTRAQQEAVAKELEQHFRDAGISQSHPRILPDTIDQISSAFDIVLIFLIIMATLLSIVGGLGLAGTMSMNVMERTREIGVLRAVGASSKSVRRIVLVEGMLVGLTSWFLSTPSPSSRQGALRCRALVFHSPTPYRYSVPGMLVWLALAVMIGAAASLAPAQRASNLTVRQVLAYE
jgi:putative ABC transport system permease protein